MEEKNTSKAGSGTVVYVLVIVALIIVLAIALSITIYQLNTAKRESSTKDETISQLQNNTVQLQTSVDELNETISNVKNTISGSNNSITTTQNTNTSANTTNTASNGVQSKQMNLGLVSVTIPKEWEENGNYSIVTGDSDASQGIAATYVFKSNSNKTSGGTIYSLIVLNQGASEENLFLDSMKTLASNSKYKVVGGTPTGVESESNPTEYNYLAKYIDTLANSVKLN